MNEFNRYSFCVQTQDVDLTHKLSPLATIDYILGSAAKDADKLGFGLCELIPKGLSWVLSRVSIEFGGSLEQGESLDIDTWIESVGRFSTIRNFEIFDTQGKTIACASSQWSMIDIERREAVDLSAMGEYGENVKPIKGRISPPSKVRSAVGEAIETRLVRYSDIDINLHTNTFCYLRWILDVVPISLLKSRRLRRMDVNFIKESRLGDTLSLKAQEYLFEIANQNQEPICRAQLFFE